MQRNGRSSVAFRTSLVVVVVAALSGCLHRGAAARRPGESWGATSSAKKSRSQPLVVEWPAADLVRLETQSKRGLVAVRYEATEIEVLDRCVVAGNYGFIGATPNEQTESIRTLDELHARVPMGFAKLEGALRASGELRVKMMVVGRRLANAPPPARIRSAGACERATHVVTGFVVGALEVRAASAQDTSGGADALFGGGGVRAAESREALSKSGELGSCGGAKSTAKEPPEGCGALLGLELQDIKEAEEAAAAAEPGVPALAWVAGGVGVAGVGVGAVTGGLAIGKKGVVQEHCGADYSCDQTGYDASRSGKTLSTVSTVSFAVGAVGIGLATYLVLSSGGEPAKKERPVKASFEPSVGPGGFSLGGRF
jgi:hypothetical protein